MSLTYRALLAGASSYADGFEPLPAVKQDVDLIRSALERRGFAVDIVSDAETSSGSALEKRFRDFCREGKTGELRLLYFSGHGVAGPTADSIVPAGTSSRDAAETSTALVDTDLSAAVADGDADLVLFIVDACRSEDDSKRPWGARSTSRTEKRFVSFLSSSPDADSFSLPSGGSAFTRALVNVLAGESAFSLTDLQAHVEAECRRLLEAAGFRTPQTPTLRHVEDTVEVRDFLAQPWIPRPVQVPQFEPSRLHVIAIQAEGVSSSIMDLANGLFSDMGRGEALWKSFRSSWQSRKLLNGSRTLAEDYSPEHVVLTGVDLQTAFDAENFDKTIRQVVEADVALVDATGFQPGAMFLLGIRAATRRGVTVVSLGDREEGKSFERPFLLVDIGYGSHAEVSSSASTEDPRFEPFLERMQAALDWLGSDSSYSDLPLHAALRVTRNRIDRIQPLGPDQGVLVLCSYEDEHWKLFSTRLRPALRDAFFRAGTRVGGFPRFLDLRDPRLISLGLADQLRRAVVCVVDWTASSKTGQPSASVFFEAGVRAAVHPRGAIHVFSGMLPEKPAHLAALRRILRPVAYDQVNSEVREYMARNPEKDSDRGYRRIYNIVCDAVAGVMEAPEDPIALLERTALAVRAPDRQRELIATQILFSEQSEKVKKAYASVGKESLYAAWLYAQHSGKGENAARLKDALVDHLELSLDEDLKRFAEISDPSGTAGKATE